MSEQSERRSMGSTLEPEPGTAVTASGETVRAEALDRDPVPTSTLHGRTPEAGRAPGAPSQVSGDDREGPRSQEDIERDIEATRERLASTVDEIAGRVKPANVTRRVKEEARTRLDRVRADAQVQAGNAAVIVRTQIQRGVAMARAELLDPEGKPRPDRVAIVGGAAAALLALVVWQRRRQ